MLRVFLPALYDDARSTPFLSQGEQRIFYEHGLLPAIQKLLPLQSTEWTSTYDDLMFAARKKNGQLSFASKMVPEEILIHLGSEIRTALAAHGHNWGTGLVFLHQIRGMKHTTEHDMNLYSAEEALLGFLRDHQLLTEDEHDTSFLVNARGSAWYVDIGSQLSSANGNCLQWRTNGHRFVVQMVCDLLQVDADKMTELSFGGYSRDMASHLPAVSGCRIAPGKKPNFRGPFGVSYLQMYLTDKAHTYLLDNGHFGKYITAQQILEGKGTAYADRLYHLYIGAVEKNYSMARIEIRVPLQHATSALIDLDLHDIRAHLSSFHPNVWWYVLIFFSIVLFLTNN